jgi:hypothetical protein
MRIVPQAMIERVRIRPLRRPIRSTYGPSTSAPMGRIANPAAKLRNVAISEA